MTVSPATLSRTLGPRSLDPAALFGARSRAYSRPGRRLTTSATALSTCGQPNPGSCVLAGTEASTSFLFLRTTLLLRAVVRGEPRDVRSWLPRCWFFPLAQVCPAAMPPRAPHLRGLRRRSIVRINVHGSKDRAKDASRGACDDVSCLRPVPTLSERRPTAFPSSATFGHPLSSARSSTAEEAAASEIEPT